METKVKDTKEQKFSFVKDQAVLKEVEKIRERAKELAKPTLEKMDAIDKEDRTSSLTYVSGSTFSVR